MGTSYEALKQAILNKQQVICTYHGLRREVCPHVIGLKNNREKILVFQFAGDSAKGLPLGGQWRCMFVDEISAIETRSGEWHTGSRHTTPQTCVDIVDAEVLY